MSYIVTYKGRFPVQPTRDDGSLGCRGCAGALPPRRTAWCSRACWDRYEPSRVRMAMRKRDKDVCAMCGYDCLAKKLKAHAEWVANGARYGTPKSAYHKPEYDHILSMADGGLTVLENMRTLCAPCHRHRTKEWHSTRKSSHPKNETQYTP